MSFFDFKKYKIRIENKDNVIMDELIISAENKNIALYIYFVTIGLYRDKSYKQCVDNCFTDVYQVSGNVIVEEIAN